MKMDERHKRMNMDIDIESQHEVFDSDETNFSEPKSESPSRDDTCFSQEEFSHTSPERPNWSEHLSERDNGEENALHKEIEALQKTIQHLQWHCTVYREALIQIPGSFQVVANTIRAHEMSHGKCEECIKEHLVMMASAYRDLEARIANNARLMADTSRILKPYDTFMEHHNCRKP